MKKSKNRNFWRNRPQLAAGLHSRPLSETYGGVGAAIAEPKTSAAWPRGIGAGHIDLRKVDIAGERVGRRFSRR